LISNKKFTLGKDERLKSRKLIERLFRDGKSFAIFPFRVYYLAVPTEGHSSLQAGFGAGSKNFKKAVDRNRIKRLTREAYRLQKQELAAHLIEKGHALAIFFIYTGKELPETALVSVKIGLALQKLIKEAG
jgi:ribonuclease P protein component